MGLIGLMNVLAIEGSKDGIIVNALSPTASTRMTEKILDQKSLKLLNVESVTAGLLYLASDLANSREILAAGAGGYAFSKILETDGIYLEPEEQSPENIYKNLSKIHNTENSEYFDQGWMQSIKFLKKASKYFGINL